MNTPEQDAALIWKALHSLGEHFDSVHIFATRHEPAEAKGTITFNDGVGNWYARYGQIREWLLQADESSRQGSPAHHPESDGAN